MLQPNRIEPIRAHSEGFSTPHVGGGGQNCKNGSCALTRCPVVSRFWSCNQVGIYIVSTPLPRCRAHTLRVSGYGNVSSHFSLSLLVRLFISLKTLLTCNLRCLESNTTPASFSASSGVILDSLLHMGTYLSLNRPYHPTSIQASLYSMKTH